MKRTFLLLALTAAGCIRPGYAPPPLAPLPFAADTVRTQVVTDGVARRYI